LSNKKFFQPGIEPSTSLCICLSAATGFVLQSVHV
jgi:hypothetical protein